MWLGAGFVVAQILAFGEALRRYTVGINGPIFFFWSSESWTPPVPSALLVVGYLVLMAGLVWWVLRSVWGRREVREGGGVPDLVPA